MLLNLSKRINMVEIKKDWHIEMLLPGEATPRIFLLKEVKVANSNKKPLEKPLADVEQDNVPDNISDTVGEKKKKPRKPRAVTSTRKHTNEKLTSYVRNSSLPMWLADIAVDFDPDHDLFYAEKIQPELDKRRDGKTRKPQIESLKRFILVNFPGVVASDVAENIKKFDDLQDLSETEEAYLTTLKGLITKPYPLSRLHRSAKRAKGKNRIAQEFATWTIFKSSFANIGN